MSSPVEEWRSEFLAAAEADDCRWIRDRFVDDQPLPEDLGLQVAERTLEVLALVAAFTMMDRGDGPEAAEWLGRLLYRQRYGGPPEDAGARIRMVLGGAGLPVDLYVGDVGDVDLEDLYEALGFHEVRLVNLDGPFDEAAVTALTEAVTADLTYDDDGIHVKVVLTEEDVLAVYISEA